MIFIQKIRPIMALSEGSDKRTVNGEQYGGVTHVCCGKKYEN